MSARWKGQGAAWIVDYFCEVCFAPAQRTNRGDLCTKHYETRRNEELPSGDEIDEGYERYKDHREQIGGSGL